MCEALRELMKDEIEAGRAEGIETGRAQGIAQGEANIIRIMHDNGNSLEQIATYTGKNLDDIKAIIEGKNLRLA